jgi:hypothetical protein
LINDPRFSPAGVLAPKSKANLVKREDDLRNAIDEIVNNLEKGTL